MAIPSAQEMLLFQAFWYRYVICPEVLRVTIPEMTSESRGMARAAVCLGYDRDTKSIGHR